MQRHERIPWRRICVAPVGQIRSAVLLTCAIAWLLVGCQAAAAEVPVVPTLAPLFQGEETGEIAVTPTPTASAALILPTPTPLFREAYLYDEELNPAWSLAQSENLTYELLDTTHWFEVMDENSGIDAGAVSLAVTPGEGWGTLYFTLQPDGPIYPRAEVQGLSFWINSGANYMSNDALVATIVGSNEVPYWQAGDTSALTEVGYFPEIPLYDLQINDSIPPNTWVKVILSMDKLLFGPDYRYVTGVYIKTKSFQSSPFHIDRVALLLAPIE
ncbi:MAG: hypothetical protein R2932_43860 [Caldilineaceae bacterium]